MTGVRMVTMNPSMLERPNKPGSGDPEVVKMRLAEVASRSGSDTRNESFAPGDFVLMDPGMPMTSNLPTRIGVVMRVFRDPAPEAPPIELRALFVDSDGEYTMYRLEPWMVEKMEPEQKA